MAVLRIVIRAGMTSEMADWLIEHLQRETEFLESLDRPMQGEGRQAFAHT
jgi:hypothetical protein